MVLSNGQWTDIAEAYNNDLTLLACISVIRRLQTIGLDDSAYSLLSNLRSYYKLKYF